MLTKNPDSFGIIAYGGWLRNPGLKAHRINGYMPNIETITSGKYPLSRPIYLYVKTQHVHADNEKHQQQPDADIGLQYLLYEFTQEYTIGPPKYDPNTEEMVEGYLIQTGFIPLDDIGRNRAREMAFGLTPMQR
jgi:phosphate transport system substrate-binding protein